MFYYMERNCNEIQVHCLQGDVLPRDVPHHCMFPCSYFAGVNLPYWKWLGCIEKMVHSSSLFPLE